MNQLTEIPVRISYSEDEVHLLENMLEAHSFKRFFGKWEQGLDGCCLKSWLEAQRVFLVGQRQSLELEKMMGRSYRVSQMPLEQMPPYIGDKIYMVQMIAAWRLSMGK